MTRLRGKGLPDLHNSGGISVLPVEFALQSRGMADPGFPIGEQGSESQFVRTFAYPIYSLHTWEEAVGHLTGLSKENGLLKALIGKIVLILPLELEDELEPLLGHDIGILRTDVANKEYCTKILATEQAQLRHSWSDEHD